MYRPMKKILVPCDFSQSSIEALKFAMEIAVKEKAEIHLVHAIELPVLYDSSFALAFEQDYMKDQRSAALKKLNKTADRWVKGAVKTSPEVAFGGIIGVIERAIESSVADLVVMGTHGASGIREYTIGSNTEKVVRNSKVPMIAIRKSVKNIKNIVLPVRPEGDLEDITMRVKSLQELFKAKLHLLFVNTPALFHRDSEIRPKMEALAKRYLLKNYTLNIFNDIAEAEGIINFTNDLKDPMVAMRTHGRRGIAHLATASVAEDVVNHIECPVWTFKIK
jgi:nucleotide-binding universal stress UspA family protein